METSNSKETTQSNTTIPTNNNNIKLTNDNTVQKISTNYNNTKATKYNKVLEETTISTNNNKEINKHQLHNSVTKSFTSPISHLTQSLNNDNKYFLPSVDGDDSDDDVIDLSSTEP